MNRPPVFVISLPGSQRRHGIAERLRPWRGEWSFIDAVDGYALSAGELAAHYDPVLARRTYGRPLSPPEIGCALAHRSAYDRILSEGHAAAIVLEDDAEPVPAFFDFPFDALGNDFDVVSFYTSRALVRRRAQCRVAGFALHRAAGFCDNTVGYLVSARGAGRLRAAARPVRCVADWPVPPERMDFFVLVPALVRHPDGASSIHGARTAMEAARMPGRMERLVGRGNRQYLTVPLFLKYLACRDRYLGVADYVRREIGQEVKQMLKPFYVRLDHDAGAPQAEGSDR